MIFQVIVEEDLEDGGYIVHCPSLKGCWSQGDTIEEALENIKEAIVGYLKTLNEKQLRDELSNASKGMFLYFSHDSVNGFSKAVKHAIDSGLSQEKINLSIKLGIELAKDEAEERWRM